MKKFVVLVLAIGVGLYFYVQSRGGLTGLFLDAVDVQSEAFLTEVAAELNARDDIPQMLDEETKLVSFEAGDGVLVYHHQLVNYDGSELDERKLVAAVKPKAIRIICADAPARERLLDRGVTLRFSYVDKFNRPLTAFDVSVSDCPNTPR